MPLYCKNKKITKAGFVGFGISNSQLYEILRNEYPELDYSFRLPIGKRESFMKTCYLGADFLKNIDEDILFFSPSIKRPSLDGDVILSSEYEYFFEKSACRVFAVSGSDGKSTTATVAKCILGEDAVLCGNIGTPTCNYVDHKGDAVAELSSFQLNYFSPHVYSAVLTSISENHIDFHGSFENYVSAKENILKNAEHTALWLDTEAEERLVKKYSPKTLISYSRNFEAIAKIYGAENYLTIKNGILLINGEGLLDLNPIFKYGEYTVRNFMSAVALTIFENGDAERAVREFTPLSERCTLVKDEGGIKYYSSSIDSSPARTATTLSRFSSDVILILGGRGKGLDLYPLKDAIYNKVRAVFFYGECGFQMLSELREDERLADIYFLYVRDFSECVEKATNYAKKGDNVLLSPAATSYDCFKNYLERGEEFKRIINKN